MRVIKLKSYLLLLLFIILSGCNRSGDPSKFGIDPSNSSTDVPPTPPPTDSGVSGLFILSGNNQIIAPGATTLQRLKVQLLEDGAPVPNRSINFSQVTISGGSFETPEVMTDINGIAETHFTAGIIAGSGTLSARYLAEEANFSLLITNQAGKSVEILSGNGQEGVVGQSLVQPYKVRVVDTVTGSPAANIAVRFQSLSVGGNFSGSLTETAQTNIYGEASVNYTLGSSASFDFVKAYILSTPNEFVTFQSLAKPGSVNLSLSTLSAASGGLIADGNGLKTVTLTLKDAFGNPIPTAVGNSIVFSTTQGTMVGSAIDGGNGTYTQNVRAPAARTSPTAVISATMNSSALTSTASIPIIAGDVDLSQSNVTSLQASIIANGVSTSLITVLLKDQNGNQVSTGGETVVMSSTVGTLLGQVVDNGDGSYTQLLRAPTYTTAATLSATVSGSLVGILGTIAFVPGPVDLARSVLTPIPVNIPPDGLSSSLIILQLKDAFGNNLVSSVGNTINFLSDRGTWIGTLFDHGDGTYSRFLQAATQNSIATITATSSGSLFSDNALLYFSTAASAPSLFNSRVDLLGSDTLPADGTSTTQIKVTLKDSSNKQMPAGGSLVAFSTTAGTLIGGVTDNGDGTYIQTLRASTSALASVIVTASVDGQYITDSASVSFYGAIHLANSTLTSFPSAIEANGTSTTLIVLKAFDQNTTPIPVGGVTGLTAAITTGTGTLLASSLTDNSNGTYSQFLRSPASAGSAIVTASKNGTPFTDMTGVEFFQAVVLPPTIDCTNISTYKNKALIIDNVTLQLNTHGASSCASDFVFTNVILRNNAVLTHSVVGTGTSMYGIELTADQIFIDATSQINVSGRGFSVSSAGNMRVPAAAGAQNLTGMNYIGGCHGGIGGRYTGSSTCLAYGNPLQPFELGASGSYTDGTWRSTAGGGRLKLKVLGTLSVDGSIKADGQDLSSPNPFYMGGSGGSVHIESSSLTGTGTISANGANTNGSTANCAGGGGGRMAIYYDQLGGVFASSATLFSKLQVYGGLCSTSVVANNGAAGTLFLKASTQSFGDLVINNNGIVTSTYSTTPLNVPALSYATNLTSSVLTKIGGFVPNYTGRFAYEGFYLDPNTLQNSTSTKFDNQYFKVTGGDDNSISLTGGDPTQVNTNIMTQPYQMMLVLNNFELRGKAQTSGNAPVLVLKGDLSSGDDTSMAIQGFPHPGLDPYSMTSVVIDMFDQSGVLADFTLKNWKGLTLKNGSVNFLTPYSLQALTLDKIALTGSVQRKNYLFDVSGNFIMQNISSITQGATGTLLNPGEEYSIEIRAANFSMSSDSSISAASKGYMARNGTKCLTVGNREIVSTSYYGASHGGNGGSGSIYGSFMNPYYSGESCYSSYNSSYAARGSGGGIVRIDVGLGNMSINGAISVNGETSPSASWSSSGGAGGSIYLSAGALSGTGNLTAIGGAAASGPSVSGGGGGGRIAVYAKSFAGNFSGLTNQLIAINAWGGRGAHKHGSAGTIYLRDKDDLYGDLLLNNNGNAQDYTTSLKIPSGPSASVNESSLVMNAIYREQSLDTGFLTGLYLNPKTSQNVTLTSRDDTLFLITNHSDDLLTTDPNLKSTGAVDGSPFSLVAILKHLEIINSAQLEIAGGGHLRIENGDLKSADGQLSIPKLGILGSGYFDLAALQTASFDQINWANSLYPLFANDVTFTSSQVEFTSSFKHQGNLTLSASTITSKVKKGQYLFDVSGNFVMQNAASIVQGPTGDLTLPGEEYSIEIKAANFSLSSDSSLSAASKGYLAKNGLKCQSVGNREIASTSYYGASHGGNGGSSNTYGSFMNPYFSGESCYSNYNASYASRGAGGGIVRIEVGSGNMTINGLISANGETSPSNSWSSAGGAGGSIYLNAGALTGSGFLTAIGGAAPSGPSVSGGGGGGRIAIHAISFAGNFSGLTNQLLAINAWGGRGAHKHGSAGTIYLKDKDDLYGDLLLNNNGNQQDYTTALKIPSGQSAAVGSSYIQMDNSNTEINYDTAFITGLYLNPNTNQNATTTSLDDQLVLVTEHVGDHLNLDGNITGVAQSGNQFSLVAILNRLEVRGLASLELKNGGHLRVIDGDFLGAATRSLNIPVMGITGDGYLDTSTVLNTTYYNINPSQNIRFVMANNVFFNNSTFNSYNLLQSAGNVTLDGSVLTGYRQRKNLLLDVAGNLIMQNGASIVQASTGNLVLAGEEYSLEMKAGNFSLSSDSSITAANKGYLAKNALKCQSVGNREIASTTTYGASYGGNGGSGNTYGSFMNPYFSGESCFSNYNGGGYASRGAGGGIVRIDVGSGNLTVNGLISANGETSPSNYWSSAGGAGGSIYLNAGALTGSGSLTAIGGAAPSGPSVSGGGGGGRIALHATSFAGNFSSLSTQLTSINAWGGVGTNKIGSAGTIYLRNKNLSFGDLLVNNNGYAQHFTTPLKIPTGGVLDQVTSTTANLSSSHRELTWDSGLLEGLYINPNTTQGNYFEILSHYVDDISTRSGLVATGQGAVNTAYGLSAIFNNLYLNSAALETVGTGVLRVQTSVTYAASSPAITGQASTVLAP